MSSGDSSKTSQESGRIVRSALDAFNGGDTETFLSHFSDDMRFWMVGTHGFSGAVESKAAFVELVGRVADGLSQMITLEIQNFLPAGEWVAVECRGKAVMKSGDPYDNQYCMLFRVAGGKVVEFKEYNDSAMVVDKFFA